MQVRYLLRLKLFKECTEAPTRSQTVKAPLRWDKTGAVREFVPSDQYIVKIHGAGRISRRNRKFLRADVPAMEEEGSRFPYGQDIGMQREIDSAWGARGHRTQSADSNDGPGGGPADGGTESWDAAPPNSRNDSYGAELAIGLEGGDLYGGLDDVTQVVELGGINFRGTGAYTGQGYQTKKWSLIHIPRNVPGEIY